MANTQPLEQLLGRLESLEDPFLAWGIVGTNLSDDEVDEVIERWIDDTNALDDPYDVLDDLVHAGLLVRVENGYRTRIGELLWEIANLRQLFPKRGTPEGPAQNWRRAPTLVDGFRYTRRPREYPRRDIDPSGLLERTTNPDSAARDVLRTLTRNVDDNPFSLAGFQERATETILAQCSQRRASGTIVGAGTGSGKTLAFYLPAFMNLAHTLDGTRRLRVLALYPRNELLKDQLQSAVQQALRLAPLLRSRSGRPARLGALFGDVPQTLRSLEQDYHRSWRKRGTRRVCPYLHCPGPGGQGCGGELTVEAQDRSDEPTLSCDRCSFELPPDVFALTRDQMRRKPPDLLFSSTEMLNRSLLDPSTGHVLGIDAAVGPDLVLLDEVHTYGGTSGAMTALAIRRWRHRIRSQPTFVGLSATLMDAPRFFGDLVGLHADQVADVRPDPEELIPEGAEYQLVLRGDPTSGAGLLSTTIQTSMLLARAMDPPGTDVSRGLFGHKVFVFTDDLDVTNRLYFDVLDAEGQRHRSGGALPYKPSLAYLRAPTHPDPVPRRRAGQLWDLPLATGHELGSTDRLRIGRTSSQDAGLDADAQVVVATASLEVGVDDPGVGGVIQHKAPRDNAAFLQRQGRAGRERGTRPITTVVLSDYGRDRATYEAWDQLLSPLLRPASLPVGNVHVLRMHAVLATLGWAAREAGSPVAGTNLWSALARPPRHDRERAAQAAIADALRSALVDEGARQRLAEHVAGALRLDATAVANLMWEPPRPLLLGAIPALLRRIHDGWQVTHANEFSTRMREDNGARQPLPEFVPPTLFSPLALPEVLVHLPTPTGGDGRERQPESMGLAQSLREFAPGRVTKRFAISHDLDRAWVAVDVASGAVEVDTFVDLYQTDGEINGMDLLRPLQMTTQRPQDDLADSSNGMASWVSRIRPTTSGAKLFLPETEPLATMLTDVVSFLHRDQRQVDVLRGVTSSDVFLRYTDGREEMGVVTLTREDDPVLLGGAFSVDALRFRARVDIPLDLWDGPLSSELRTAYFRDDLQRRLDGTVNPFLVTWLHDVVLNALLDAAIRTGDDLETTWGSIRESLTERLDTTLKLLFAVDELDLGDAGTAITPRKLRDRLAKALEAEPVALALDQAVAVLWSPAVEDAQEWLHRRILRTLGELLLKGAALLCPEHDPETAVVDVIGTPDGDEIWISEQAVGGGGFLEAVVDACAAQPDRLFRLGRATLRPSTEDLVGASLERVVGLATSDTPIRRIFADFRTADRAATKAQVLGELRAALAGEGIPATPEVVGAIANRLLRVGSSSSLDERVAESVSRWRDAEDRLGVEVPVRTWAYLDAAAADGTAEGSELEQLQTVLWPRGAAPRNSRYASYNPYSREPDPAPTILSHLLNRDAPTPVQVEDPDGTWASATAELRSSGLVRLQAAEAERGRLLDVLARSATQPVELDHLRVNARVTEVGAGRDGGAVATLELPLLGRWRGAAVEPMAAQPVRTRRIMTAGGGRVSEVEQFHQLLFTLELLQPSEPLWIVSAWLSDVAVVDNRGAELLSVAPGLPVRRLGLVEVLTELVGRGADIRVVVRDDPHNRSVVGQLQQLERRTTAGSISIESRRDLHDKVIAGQRLLIEGSMNLTHSGALKNEEGVRVVTDPVDIATQRHELARRFGGST